MDEVFQLQDPQSAQQFLRTFPAEVQRRGHERFREGRVQDLTVTEPGRSYAALVRDSAWDNQVTLNFDPEAGWAGLCSCPSKTHCVHIFAAMIALLAEHRTALVRQLSAGQPAATGAPPGPKAKA